MKFDEATLSKLSPAKRALLERRLKGHATPARQGVAIRPLAGQESAPLSFAQQRLWFIDQLFPQSAAYNLHVSLRLSGALDIAALTRSFNAIIRRHEMLRTTFPQADGRPVQLVAPQLSLDIPLVDLCALAPERRFAEASRLASEEAQAPFDLQRGPLLRAQLLRLEEREHALLLTMHHIIADGWSIGILVQELAVFYRAFSAGTEAELPELELQYRDYARWQREWMTGEVLERELEYWRSQLSGSSLVLELPTDKARPAVQRQRGAQIAFSLSAELSEKLRTLSLEHDVTLYMTLLGVFLVLLHRYSQQEDIIVGSPIANRTRREIEGLIGFFVNTLALRTDLSGNPSYRELLRRVKEATLEAYAHQDVPFEKLVEELQPERDMSRPPLFQVMFMLQNEPIGALELPGLQLSPLPVESAAETFDLTLIMKEIGEGIGGALSYDADLFEEATARRMCAHLLKLLEGVVAAPEQRISEIPLLTEEERRQLLFEWSEARFESKGEGQLLQSMFEEQARRAPERTAIVYEGAQLTYAELDRRSNRVANYLAAIGVGPESIVGVLMERALELPVALLGVLKAGGAYLPLDPEYPHERLSWMLKDSGARVVLTQAALLDRLDGLDHERLKAVCMDQDCEAIAAHSTEPTSGRMSAEHTAYVIYTSGSTGRPKGVMVSHRAICNRLSWGARLFPLRESDSVLQSTTISFDVSVSEFFTTLTEGARLVLPKPGGHQDVAYLIELMETEQVSILNVVPSLLQVLIDEEGFRRCRSLRQVFVGGEAMPVQLPSRFFAVSRAELYNFYGPTETAIDATWWKCGAGDAARRSIPIGRPVGNLRLYLLDERLQPVPPGVPAELYIGGAGLARGYLGRPDLTAEKFIPNPFAASRGERLYRTGDLARHLPGGEVEFLRRVDEQVKIRGFRIETGEVEAALLKHPSVRNVVVRPQVLARKGPARLSMDGDGQLSGEQLSALDQERLLKILEEIEALPESETEAAPGQSS